MKTDNVLAFIWEFVATNNYLDLNFKVITVHYLSYQNVPVMFFVDTSAIKSNAISKVVSCVSLQNCVRQSLLDDGAVSLPIPTPTKYILLEKLNGLNQD
jgi:hypothetical protein